MLITGALDSLFDFFRSLGSVVTRVEEVSCSVPSAFAMDVFGTSYLFVRSAALQASGARLSRGQRLDRVNAPLSPLDLSKHDALGKSSEQRQRLAAQVGVVIGERLTVLLDSVIEEFAQTRALRGIGFGFRWHADVEPLGT